MDDKYEVLNKGENDANQATPAVSVSGVSHSGSPAADATPLLDQEADLLKSTTDLNTKKFQSEKEKVKKTSKKLIIIIYVGAMMISIIAFNVGITIGYYAL